MLKRLSIICCLILFLPFLQTCSDESLTEFPYKKIQITDESGIQTEAFSKRKAENTMTGYQLALFVLTPFSVVLGLTFLNVYFSFINYHKTFIAITILNLLINVAFLGWLYFTETISDVKQIKYGYYLFFIVLFMQLFFSVKNLEKLKK